MTGQEWWRPHNLARRKRNLTLRGHAVTATRAFFASHGFTEVETPCLQISPGLEAHLMPFATVLEDGAGEADRPLFLHTSPEFAMKKLLAGGMERIWQMARVFRNAERSDTHHPEFTMIEWYRAGGGLDDLISDCEGLFRATAAAAGATLFRRGAQTCDPFQPFERLSFAEAFSRYADIDILATAPDPLAPDRDRLAGEALRIGVRTGLADHWDDIVFRILLDRIEPEIGRTVPTVLHSWPLSMAALARPGRDDPRIAERFEIYALGLELANAFGELTDAAEQRRRFAAEAAVKAQLYGRHVPIDEDFLAALDAGLPESAGIALGFDRLVMLLTGAATIDDVLWAPVANSS